MHVGVRRLTLRASQCHSLKDKRAVLRKLESRVRARFHVAIAEVGDQNIWQRVIIGFAVVGSDRVSVERMSAEIARFIEDVGDVELIRDEHELLAYGDGPVGEEAMPADPREPADPSNSLDDPWFPADWKDEGEVE